MKSNVEITIGQPVPDDGPPKNTFQLCIEYMHGDAEGDSDREILYSQGEIEELKRDYAALQAINDMDDTEELEEYFNEQGEEDPAQAAEDFRDQFREGDHTTDFSTSAQISGLSVFWYDANGVQHFVDISVDGQKLT